MTTCIGQTVFLKGTLSAAEDIRIAGRIEGEIELHEHVLTVQPTAELTAGVMAKAVIVEGAVRGDIIAGESVALQGTASVAGKIAAPKISIFDGADFNGRVETAFPKN
jgi:cytoskeletal protein CcmA (bactofilin family)